MTLNEKVEELRAITPALSTDDIKSRLEDWKASRPVQGPEPESVSLAEESMSFQTAAAPQDASVVAPELTATEEIENTESQSIDGLSELPKFTSVKDVDIFNKQKVNELKIKKLDPNNFKVIKPELFTRIGLELHKEELKKEKELKRLKDKEKDLYLDAKKQISSTLGDSIGSVNYDDLESEDQLKIIDLAKVQIF